MSINIITLNTTILQRLEQDEKNNKERLNLIQKLLSEKNLTLDVYTNLNSIKNQIMNDFAVKELFLAETYLLIDEYKKILKNPISHKKENNLPILRKKHEIIINYLNIVNNLVKNKKKWNDILIPFKSPQLENPKSFEFYCPSCGNIDENKFEIDEFNRRTCLDCSTQQSSIETGITHKDYSRVNIVGKFIYNRILHFQDCIKQYQGKQNCKIPEQLYIDLDKKFQAYRLIINTPLLDNTFQARLIRYSKITRNHIMMFLKELKYVKHYENVNLIYFTLTNQRVDDISHLEEQLMEDFKELVALYDELHGRDKKEELDRKNFMNVQYLLFQLLRRHNHPCKIEDFTILKTIDRKLFHDTICKNLFNKLGWKFTPTF